ncbi:adenosylcobinamide-GDP ribazoletransferase [Rhizobiales bacterium]|uniref:adenosylcobinamide-GDP ribazoletransferase n=1 Tax=Hongsoonwoonella zoysiae TaxID=2821844 RepID=UPI00156026A5|nr:adenosylcobinamide-GDP ribazoletransferase [Hongsoonwoonella zoysiae]NRG18332.1 adenosylcobinamide-GDP ribazoletransferase [Hongsoonwoonella zoysiae]
MGWSTADLLAEIAAATRFFSRLPIPKINRRDDPLRLPDFTLAGRIVPVAGALIAIPGALFLLALSFSALPAMATALFAILLTCAVTGALHEDGLADVADGFFGGATRERRLEIMKDSRTGAFGALALASSLLLSTVLLATLIDRFGGFAASLSFLAAHAASRAAMIRVWQKLPPARPDGLARICGAPSGYSAGWAIAIAAAFSLPVLFLLPFTAFLLAALGLIASALGMERLALGKIGGHTGDVLGATQQVAMVLALAGLAAVA